MKATWSPSEIEGHLNRLIKNGFVDNDPGDNLVVTALGRSLASPGSRSHRSFGSRGSSVGQHRRSAIVTSSLSLS